MAEYAKLSVRDAEAAGDDVQFIIEAFDSTLTYLESIGSGEQWGEQPFSKRDGFQQETEEMVAKSKSYRLTRKGEPVRVFVAEVEVSPDADDDPLSLLLPVDKGSCHRTPSARGRRFVRVGAAVVRENWLPPYLLSLPSLKMAIDEVNGRHDYVFLEVMVADFRVPESLRKGVGAALIRRARDYALEEGKERVLVDCWSGNGRKLNR